MNSSTRLWDSRYRLSLAGILAKLVRNGIRAADAPPKSYHSLDNFLSAFAHPPNLPVGERDHRVWRYLDVLNHIRVEHQCDAVQPGKPDH